jgi:hypothetical protein
MLHTESDQSCGGKYQAINLAVLHLAQPGLHIAPNVLYLEGRISRQQLCLPTPTARANTPRTSQLRQATLIPPHIGIARFTPRWYGPKVQARRQRRWHILHTVYSKINILLEQGVFNFFDKESFGPELGQWIAAVLISRCPNDDHLHGEARMMRPEGVGDRTRLPQRQRTTARPEAYTM